MALVETDLDGGVLTVTMVDEDNRNALSSALVGELVAALDVADADPAVRVVVLTNSGRVFCAGADLSERSSGDKPTVKVDAAGLFSRFRRSPKVYVGRIAGHCVAGGMGLAAAMDLSVAVEDARFGFTEVRRGVAPAMISVLCLPRMRPSDAAEAMLLGNRMTGADAARLAGCPGRHQAASRPGTRHAGRRGVRLDRAAVGRPVPERRGPGGHAGLPGEALP